MARTQAIHSTALTIQFQKVASSCVVHTDTDGVTSNSQLFCVSALSCDPQTNKKVSEITHPTHPRLAITGVYFEAQAPAQARARTQLFQRQPAPSLEQNHHLETQLIAAPHPVAGWCPQTVFLSPPLSAGLQLDHWINPKYLQVWFWFWLWLCIL